MSSSEKGPMRAMPAMLALMTRTHQCRLLILLPRKIAHLETPPVSQQEGSKEAESDAEEDFSKHLRLQVASVAFRTAS